VLKVTLLKIKNFQTIESLVGFFSAVAVDYYEINTSDQPSKKLRKVTIKANLVKARDAKLQGLERKSLLPASCRKTEGAFF
jgi:hypothetical protein